MTDDFFVVHSDGIPDHDTGPFPNAAQPQHRSASRTTRSKSPASRSGRRRSPERRWGRSAWPINGVPFYNPYNREGEDAAKVEVFDDCCGHPDPMGRYHYHIYPKCIHTCFKDEPGKHSPLIGYAFDGYAIYGPNGEGGKPPADLDECNGHTDKERGYHYHVSGKFPYILGGYHGVVEASNMDRGRPGGGGGGDGRRGPPPGGSRPPRPDFDRP